MKSYREIADSVFERRERYMAAQQRKRKHTVSAITSICSCALVALVGASVWRSGVLTEDPPMSEGKPATTTVTKLPVTEGPAVTTAPSTSASHSGVQGTVSDTQPTVTQTKLTATQTQSMVTPTIPTTAPSKPTATQTQSTVTPTIPTTAPSKLLITADAPDDYCMDNQNESSLYAKPISPLLQETMGKYEDTDAVYAVLVAIRYPVRHPQSMPDDSEYDPIYYAAYQEFLKTDKMVSLIEKIQIAYDEYIEAEKALSDEYSEELLLNYQYKKQKYADLKGKLENNSREFFEDFHTKFSEQSLQMLAELSEIEPCNLNRVDPQYPNFSCFDNEYHWGVAMYSWRGRYAYSAVLSADAIRELAEQGRYAFWLDAPDTNKEIDYGAIIDMG